MEIQKAFKHCLRCGSKAQLIDNKLHCPACGLDFYLNPKPANSVILKNEGGEYLFVVRAHEPKKGYLDFPGGFVDEGENFEGAARREVKEELGIEVGKLEYLNNHKDIYPFQEIVYDVVGIAFLGLLPKDAKLKPADDVSGVEFYKLDDVPMNRLAWKSMHEMIAQIKSSSN